MTAALLLPALGAGACADEEAPFNRLEGLRVLTIKSEPVVPGPGEETTLSALVFTPGGETVSYEWSWCPVAAPPGAACPVSPQDLASLAAAGPPAPGAAGGLPPLDLGAGETARLRIALPPELLAQLCTVPAAAQMAAMSRGFGAVPPRCTGGFPIQIKLVVRTETSSVTAVRTLRLRIAEGDGHANPKIEGLAAVIEDADRPLEDGSTVLPRLKETKLVARVAPDASEPYTDRDDDGNPVPSRERLWLTWFVEAGDTKFQRTTFIDGATPLEQALENRWKPPQVKDFPGEKARLFVVLHDNRGGVGWTSATVRLGGLP